MSDFKAEMHQIQFRLGIFDRPWWGSLQHSPNPLAGFKGPTSKGRGGEKWKWREKRAPLYFFLQIYAHGDDSKKLNSTQIDYTRMLFSEHVQDFTTDRKLLTFVELN